MTIFKNSFGLLFASLLLLMSSAPQARDNEREMSETAYTFDIPAGQLTDALRTIGRQSGKNVMFNPALVEGKTAPQLQQTLTIHQAITRLLNNTNLTYEPAPGDTILIKEKRPVALNTDDSEMTGTVRSNPALRLAQAEPASTAAADKKAAESPNKDAQDKIQEIVVTAQKREERLQDVPIAISVLGGEQLDESRDRGVAEALNRVPGVITAYNNGNARTGSATGGVVVVRGVAPSAGGSTTGYYLDTIPFGFVGDVFNAAYAPDPSAYDLERVEVLRGPQGTLYGVSALNGVVRVLTKDADLNKFEFKGRGGVSSTAGGGENYRGDVAINIPLIEGKLAARAVVGYQDWSGWIDKPFKKDANDTQAGNYRLKINAQPTEQLSASLLAWISRADVGAPPSAADGRTSVSLLNEPSAADYDAYGFKLAYDLPAFTVTSMTSYLDYSSSSAFDYTPFIANETVLNTLIETEMFSEEVVLNSTAEGPWRWTAGGMYRDTTDHLHQFRSQYVSGPIGTNTYVESKSTTIFGELTRAFADGRFELTGGLRYFEDKKTTWETSRSTLVGGTIEPPLQPNGSPNPRAGLFGLLQDEHGKYDKVTPRLVMTWHPNPQASIYASYAEGFRSGLNQLQTTKAAFPNIPPADPDDVKSYELGAKGNAWDGRLSFDSAVYYLDWTGVQQNISIIASTVPFLLTAAAVNAKSVSGMGAELGVSLQATDGLTLSTNLNWNDLQVDEDVFTGTTLLYAKGQRINFSPEYTASASADYAFALGASGRQGHFTVSGNYVPKMINDRASAAALFYSEPMTMVRASIGVESAGRWGASLYGDNLTNEKAFAFDRFNPRWNMTARPRTFGVQVEYHY